MADNETPPRAVDASELFGQFSPTPYDEWRTEAERLLRGAPFDKKLLTPTPEGITLKPIYRQEDAADISEAESVPGYAPFLRGRLAWRNSSDAWQMAQELIYPDHESFNEALRHDLERGLTAVMLPLDRASRRGVDPDSADPIEVGRDGVSISSLSDLGTTLDGVDLMQTPVYIECGTSGLPYLGAYVALAEENGKEGKLTGALVMDPLGELVTAGSLPMSIGDALTELTGMTAWAVSNQPKLGTVWVHGEAYHNGGANAVQELAFALATGVAYLRALEERGVEPKKAARHFRFSFGLGTHFFMEIAKLRAARLMWHRIAEQCGVDENDRGMWIHARTSRYTKTTYDPYVNMLRTTTEAFSGAIAGCDSLHVSPFDEHLRPVDEFSRRIARNTQTVIKDEVRLGRLLDPAGGSWFVERLTAELAETAWGLFQETEKRGGLLVCLEDGWVQSGIKRVADKRAAAVSKRRQVIVGTNQYPIADETPLDRREFDHEAFHSERSKIVKEARTANSDESKAAVLRELETLMNAEPLALAEAALKAAKRGATVGEIVRALPTRKSKGTRVTPVPYRRAAEGYEALRSAVESFRKDGGAARVFVATIGKRASFMPRLDFATTFFRVGGFAVERAAGDQPANAAATAAVESKAPVVVICGVDDSYPEGAPVIAEAVKKARPDSMVVLAGLPADDLKRSLEQAGVDLFIHQRSDTLAVLNDIAKKLGVAL
ncbi:methylmalonyl-CoA mutase [candidate division GN15 bacterium]|nr:methylmalonyl-CoA mutase [candidate division GN15 bacterium]